MSSNGPDDPSGKKPTSDHARNLFGHRGGVQPWDDSQDEPEAPPTNQSDTSSAPYPRDAQYTPRPAGEVAPSLITEDVDDDGELTKLHPNYKMIMQIGALFIGFFILIGALILDTALNDQLGTPWGIIIAPAAILAIIVGFRVPIARYNARGYQISRDRLRVVRGIWWHSDTIVPFGRVQHIDVDQGPLERALGIATMTLHTAGSHNASVRLPGLGHELAVEMREEIRAHIKRESM